jgi:hypothetical protein
MPYAFSLIKTTTLFVYRRKPLKISKIYIRNIAFFLKILTPFLYATTPNAANAWTECSVTVQKAYAGDGQFWIVYTNGGSAFIQSTDPDYSSTISMAISAILGARPVTVRYVADNVPCAATARSDLQGLWLQ